MPKTYSVFFFALIFSFFVLAGGALGISGADLIRLKEAGLSDKTIELIIKEKTIETCALTVSEILSLRKSGVGDATIRMVVEQGSFIKEAGPVIYGKDIRPITFCTANDLIELKRAGLSDEVIRAIIVYSVKDRDHADCKKAWNMLNSMGIVVDKRNQHD